MFMACDTKSDRYCTDLDDYNRKNQQVSVHAKCYNKEIMSPTYLSESTYQIKFLYSLADLVKVSHN